MLEVSIVIPTFCRPDLLRAAVRSCLAQTGIAADQFEIVVVDNCPDASAGPVLAEIITGAPKRVRLIHEPRPGISHARNTGVSAASADLIAFLDDDETAAPGWLAAFLATRNRTGADAVFGPVEAALPQEAEVENADFFLEFFSRRWDLPEGQDLGARTAFLGTNNSLFVKSRCLMARTPFEIDLGTVGGEDSLLLKRLHEGGARFAWSRDAKVGETISPNRLNYDYVRRRRFRSGQIRSIVCWRAGGRRELAFWMAVGLVQAIAYGAAALPLWLSDRKRAEMAVSKAAGGLGKILWSQRFLFPMYGAT